MRLYVMPYIYDRGSAVHVELSADAPYCRRSAASGYITPTVYTGDAAPLMADATTFLSKKTATMIGTSARCGAQSAS
jgi:hypothetical protein